MTTVTQCCCEGRRSSVCDTTLSSLSRRLGAVVACGYFTTNPSLLAKSLATLERLRLLSDAQLAAFATLNRAVDAAARAAVSCEEALGEAPDEVSRDDVSHKDLVS